MPPDLHAPRKEVTNRRSGFPGASPVPTSAEARKTETGSMLRAVTRRTVG